MELKEAILSTLAELQETPASKNSESFGTPEETIQAPLSPQSPQITPLPPEEKPLPAFIAPLLEPESASNEMREEERRFLEGLRERVLVLFEGMQSPNNRNIEAKVELTLNFFEYLLSVIDERLEKKN